VGIASLGVDLVCRAAYEYVNKGPTAERNSLYVVPMQNRSGCSALRISSEGAVLMR
jgi:kynureninase